MTKEETVTFNKNEWQTHLDEIYKIVAEAYDQGRQDERKLHL